VEEVMMRPQQMNSSNVSFSDKKGIKGLFTTQKGDLKLFWVFMIIPVYLLFVLITTRIVFIIIQTQIFLVEGYQQQIAVELARTQMMSLEAQAILGIFDALLMVLLVYILIKKGERREFHWSTIGMDFKSTSIPFFIIGSITGFLFIVITRYISLVTGTLQIQLLSIEEIFSQSNVKFMIYFYIWAILNGFWQEIVFRGYLQTRMVEKYDPIVGIPAASIYFILIHFIDRELTVSWVIAGTLLAILISLIYHHTKSLFLVGAIHGSINYFDPVTELAGVTWISPISDHYIESIVPLGFLIGIYLAVQYFRDKNRTPGKEVAI
jgi:membrane protease YdiL (CAAX protease family)